MVIFSRSIAQAVFLRKRIVFELAYYHKITGIIN